MESIIGDKLKKSNSPFLNYFEIWKSRLKPEKRHWIAAAVYVAVTFLISLGISFAVGLPPEFYYIDALGLIMGLKIVSIVFSVLFYFFYFKYFEVKRLSDFLPVANAILVLYLALELVVYGFVYPTPDFIAGGALGVVIMSIFDTVSSYPLLAFQGMGAMALFLKKFEKSFLAKCLLLALLSFIFVPFIQNLLVGLIFVPFIQSQLGSPYYGAVGIGSPPLDYFVSPSNWPAVLTFFFLFCFIFHFGKGKWKKPFLLVLALLFAGQILGSLIQALFYTEITVKFLVYRILLEEFALPVSFTIIALLCLLFLKFSQGLEEKKAAK